MSGDGESDVDGCGEEYDHDLRLIDERAGEATYECRVCGAEVATEPSDVVEGAAG